MNISTVINQLAAFRELYGDLRVFHIVGGVYTPLLQAPWLASPIGAVPGPSNYVVVFGPNPILVSVS